MAFVMDWGNFTQSDWQKLMYIIWEKSRRSKAYSKLHFWETEKKSCVVMQSTYVFKSGTMVRYDSY